MTSQLTNAEQLTLTAWNLLAGNYGIVPDTCDLQQLCALRVELAQFNHHPRDCFILRKHADGETDRPAFDLCFRSEPGRSAYPIATCWIEYVPGCAPFFYWES